MVGDNLGRDSVEAEDFSIVDIRNALHINVRHCWKDVYLLTVVVNVDNDCIILTDTR